MEQVSVEEAQARLDELLERVQRGESFLICRDGQPVVQLTAFRKRPRVGTITSGPVTYTDDCWDALTDCELADWGL